MGALTCPIASFVTADEREVPRLYVPLDPFVPFFRLKRMMKIA